MLSSAVDPATGGWKGGMQCAARVCHFPFSAGFMGSMERPYLKCESPEYTEKVLKEAWRIMGEAEADGCGGESQQPKPKRHRVGGV